MPLGRNHSGAPQKLLKACGLPHGTTTFIWNQSTLFISSILSVVCMLHLFAYILPCMLAGNLAWHRWCSSRRQLVREVSFVWMNHLISSSHAAHPAILQRGVIGHSVSHLLLACIPCHIPSAVLPTLGTSGTREFCVFANKWRQKQDQIEFIKVDKHPPAVSLSLSVSSPWAGGVGAIYFLRRRPLHSWWELFHFTFLPSAMDQTVRVTCISELLHDSSLYFFVCLFSSRQRVVAHYICALEVLFFFSSNTEPGLRDCGYRAYFLLIPASFALIMWEIPANIYSL